MRYLNKILLTIIFILVLVGCGKNDNYDIITCSKKATLSDNNTTANLEYKIYYKGKYVKKTISTETITSNSSETLKEYEKSYKEVFKKYRNIKYYNNTITLDSNTVISKTIIDYTKVDSKKIVEIEGEEGNIFTDEGQVKLDTLLKLYKKYGSTCDD